MPTPVYYFQIRSAAGHGNSKCQTQAEANELYAKVGEAISSNADFVELNHDGEKTAIRVAGIQGFSVICQMEPTKEEIEAQQEEYYRNQAKLGTMNQVSPIVGGRLIGC